MTREAFADPTPFLNDKTTTLNSSSKALLEIRTFYNPTESVISNS